MKKVKKAVLPVAGLGTRIQPAAKTTPKEMLNVYDRPLIVRVIAEAREAGVEHFVFVTGRGKAAIEDYFDHHVELEAQLEGKGKAELLAEIRAELPRPGEMSFVRQMAPLGLGHAVWCAREVVGDEPFAVMLPDTIMEARPSALAQAIAAYDALGGNVVIVEPAPPGETYRYGVVELGERSEGFSGRLARMVGMVEKPPLGTEPSNLFISGRYVLQPQIFALLAAQEKGAGGEIQLTDAMVALMASQPFHALAYDGVTYDCGDVLGLLRANVAYALKDGGPEARKVIEETLKDSPPP
jgi:UTP--glucose-1-phosphate uridylyltransferase